MKALGEIEDIFQTGMKKIWSDFEKRKEQVEMSLAIEKALEGNYHLIVEAGTGVGKSLAYLLPAALHSIETEMPVIISTETIALQNQLIKKDIPMISKILGKEIRAEIALGANNYVCKRRLSNMVSSGNFSMEMKDHLKEFYAWEKETETGIKSEYDGFAVGEFWNQVTRDSDSCLGRRCPNFEVSYYFLEKEKWNKAHIVIVNHYLLAAHIAGEFKILPSFDTLVLDEAHNFPDILGRAFGKNTSYDELAKIMGFIGTGEKKGSLLHKLSNENLVKKMEDIHAYTNKSIINFFNKLYSEIPISFTAQRVQKNFILDEGALEENLLEFAEKLEVAKKDYPADSQILEEKEILLEIDYAIGKLKESADTINRFRTDNSRENVAWIEPPDQMKKEQYPKIFVQPLHPEKILTEKLIPRIGNVIFTSATLSSGKKDFKFFKNKIGNIESEELLLASPFDYQKNCLIYLPKNIRDPAEYQDEYHDDLITLIPMLLDITKGNAFILFTSFKSLMTVEEGISKSVRYPIFSQKEMGAEKAKNEFLNTDNSVLMGVSTFWQGIDIRGDKLKSVIITKLPFQPPNEPVLEARIEEIKKKNGNPFGEIQLPQAILTLKQGFGRLIRSKSDTGIVCLLDPRIQTKSYGRQILDSLPPAKRVYSYKELKQEYAKLPISQS